MKIQEHTLVSQRMKQEWMKTSLLFLWKILLERPVCIETITHTQIRRHTLYSTLQLSFFKKAKAPKNTEMNNALLKNFICRKDRNFEIFKVDLRIKKQAGDNFNITLKWFYFFLSVLKIIRSCLPVCSCKNLNPLQNLSPKQRGKFEVPK